MKKKQILFLAFHKLESKVIWKVADCLETDDKKDKHIPKSAGLKEARRAHEVSGAQTMCRGWKLHTNSPNKQMVRENLRVQNMVKFQMFILFLSFN